VAFEVLLLNLGIVLSTTLYNGCHPLLQMYYFPVQPSFNMHRDCIFQSTLSQIVGNPYHHPTCQGIRDDGTQCRNDVPKMSRINSAIQLGLFRGGPDSLPSESVLTGAAKSMLCAKCRPDNSRAKQCTQRWIQEWNATLNPADIAPTTPNPRIYDMDQLVQHRLAISSSAASIQRAGLIPGTPVTLVFQSRRQSDTIEGQIEARFKASTKARLEFVF
jgi:hypothetical protein